MSVPSSVIRGIEEGLESRLNSGCKVVSTSPVGGGCINPSARVETEGGEGYFLKWNPAASPEMFEAEADGLRGLAAARALRVPEVLGLGGSGTHTDPGWLLLEFIPQGRPGPDYGRALGEGLADLHNSPRLTPRSCEGTEQESEGGDLKPEDGDPEPGGGAGYGWHRDNFIGSLPQENSPLSDWAAFWRDRRLEPQLQMARDHGHFKGRGGSVLDELLERMDEVMAGSSMEGPALLHGDLWSGNFYPGPSGEPVIIDPAVYRGVGEVDLAMMELFGSFPRGFREGYGSTRELAPEYDAFRRDLYQLFYLLVHVNLFGGGYVSGSLSAAERALRGG